MPTLTPAGGLTYCTVEVGEFSRTYDGSVSTWAGFKRNQSCLSEWYWIGAVNVTKFYIHSHYYSPLSRINAIWGRVNGDWVMVWGWGEWKPRHGTWDNKTISCNNCTGIRISQTHASQAMRPYIAEVKVDYEIPPPEEGKATIVSIDKPDNFTPGESFHIKPKVRNDGGADKLFVRLIDKDTGNVLKDFTSLNVLPEGQLWTQDMIVTLTQETDFHGRIEAGHIE